MRWNAKYVPRAGDERTVIIYAYTPIRCNQGHNHWLEKVKVNQFWGSYTKTWRPLSTRGESGVDECYCPDIEDSK